MSQDVSLPYTGSSSSSFVSKQSEEVKRKQEEKRKEKEDTRSKISPAEDVLKEQFEKEYAELKNIDYVEVVGLIGVGDRALEVEMLANKKTIARLKDIETRLNNILRQKQ